ncbi:MAG: response regulator [Candidatus Omnitrophica bacterium]|nr:response regulator [Candidatus Omnitrophota bacterium]
MKARLEGFGYSVTAVPDSRQAWQEVLAEPPDVILLDIRLPDEDGYTFLKKLRSFSEPDDASQEERIRKLPVIVITGTGEGMKSLFEQEQITAYVTKPVDSSALKKIIEKTLG